MVGLGEPERIDPYDDLLASAVPDPEADPLDLDLLTTILYTSGTTGRPKGAMIDRAGLTARVFVNATELDARSRRRLPRGAADVPHLGLPRVRVRVPRRHGPPAPDLLRRRTGSSCSRHEQATATVLVPTMISMLLDDPAIDDYDTSGRCA